MLDGRLSTSINRYPDSLRDHYILQRDGIMHGIIQFIRLANSSRSDRVHNLWYLGWVECAVRVVTCSSTHTERERLRCRGKATCLVWTKAILAGQRHCKAPT